MRIVSCTRAEAERQLTELADGCLGDDSFRAKVRAALGRLRAGQSCVTAGHTTYRIPEEVPLTENDPFEMYWSGRRKPRNPGTEDN